MYKTPAIEGDI